MKKNTSQKAQKDPPVDLLKVRAAFILRGDSLHGWAKRQGMSSQYVNLALRGLRRGPVARQIVNRVIEELNAG